MKKFVSNIFIWFERNLWQKNSRHVRVRELARHISTPKRFRNKRIDNSKKERKKRAILFNRKRKKSFGGIGYLD